MTPARRAAAITPEAISAAADRIAAAGDSEPRLARDPVNLPMIRNWLEALGDARVPAPVRAPGRIARTPPRPR